MFEGSGVTQEIVTDYISNHGIEKKTMYSLTDPKG